MAELGFEPGLADSGTHALTNMLLPFHRDNETQRVKDKEDSSMPGPEGEVGQEWNYGRWPEVRLQNLLKTI